MKFFDNWQKVCLFLTRKCNLKCRGCNVINHISEYELSIQEWIDAFKILKDYNVGFVVLFGGEPTLRDDLPELVVALNNLEMPHTIITNGMRLMKDQRFYNRLIKARPYGLSTSVNTLEVEAMKYHDNLKSDIGHKLLLKLKKDIPNADLVANMAVTKDNIKKLPDIVSYFSRLDIWSILSFFHVGKPSESMFWQYRGCENEKNRGLVFTKDDESLVNYVASYFITNYEKLKLHNSKKYFTYWRALGISQDWKCNYWVCPSINSDGSLMACIDRLLTKPISIFDLPEKEEELKENFKKVIIDCPGCFWDHMFETNMYAIEKRAEYGKRRFAHAGMEER
jgi:MoaA/NifB/PqqE/SkfB family radical SAM enzyme